MAKYLEWSRGVEEGEILGPTIYTTGPTLRGSSSEEPRGNPDAVLTTAKDIRTEVANQYEAGYRMLKLYDFLSAEAFHAALEEAKARGMYTIGHVPYSVGIEGVTEAGMDELAHIHSFHQDFFKDFDPANVFDEYPIEEDRIPEIVAMVKAAGTRVCVTLIVNQTLLDSQDPDSYLERPMMAYELPWAKPYMRSAAWYFNKMWPRTYLEETYLPWLYRLTKALHDADVMLVLGTDSGVTGLVHGFSTQEELSLLVKAGLSPYEALLTGTRNAAIASGDADDWGTIEIGKRADMILLADNPLNDIRNAQRILGVVKAGHWLDREKLDRLLDDVLRAY
jgi:imidazolonepropionase-like amidohydrolase